MKVALNDKDIKEVNTESMCMECVLYTIFVRVILIEVL